jgi:phosphoglycolate phosphatase
LAVSHVLADHGLPAVTEEDVRIFMGQGSKVTMGKAFAKHGAVPKARVES